jgi:transposase InsO family protein
MSSPAIARRLGMPNSTVPKVLRRLGLNRLTALGPPTPVVRYQRARPGDLLHLDTKKLGRIAGIGHRITGRRTGAINRHHGIDWERLHVCIDDACRLASGEILPDERKETANGFLKRALAWFAGRGVVVERVMTDNSNCYRNQLFRQACAGHGLRHLRTRAYTPRPNGKAERFIQTQLARVGLCPALCQLAAASRGVDHLARPVQYRAATHRLGRPPTGSAVAPISVALFDRRDRCFVPTFLPR